VQGTHTYTDESTGDIFPNQAYTIRVTIHDDSANATAASSATILEELLPGGVRGTPTQRFVSETYRDLLHRPVDQSGLDTWSPQIDALVAQGMPIDQAQKTVVF